MKGSTLIGIRQRLTAGARLLKLVRPWNAHDRWRIGNAITCLTSVRRSHLAGQPFFAQIEPTTVCNLHCRFCLNPTLPRPRHSLSLRQFEQILDALPGLLFVNLQGCGEPTLNPDLFRMAAEARRRRIFVSTVTNLNVDGATIARLATSGFNSVNISIESADPATYEWYRRGGDFTRFTKSLRLYADLKRRNGRGNDGAFWVTVTRETEDALESLFEFAARTGAVRRVQVQLLQSKENYILAYDSDVKARLFPAAADEETRIRQRLQRCSRKYGIAGSLVAGRCRWPWGGIFVNAEGRLAPCCSIKDFHDPSWGDIEGLRGAWHSADWVQLREGLLTGDFHRACRGCPAARTPVGERGRHRGKNS